MKKTSKPALIWLALLLCLLALGGCGREKDRLDQQVRELCAKDGGIKVYEQVVLPADKFDKVGNIQVPSRDMAKPSDEYYYIRTTQYIHQGSPESGKAEMHRTLHQIVRRSDNKVLGESVRYSRRGGDAPGPWHPSSFTCPPISTEQPKLETSVFIKKELP